MPKQNFLLVSLEDSQSKQLAEVLSNDTSRKIIDYLSEHEDATETEISTSLTIPLPTVHYNLQKLKEAQLVHVEEFHYSKKGREVDHYKLANKYVIITPKPVKGIKNALKHILPASLLFAGITVILALVQSVQQKSTEMFVANIAERAVTATPSFAADVAQAAPQSALPFWFWFLMGGIVMFILIIMFSLIRRK